MLDHITIRVSNIANTVIFYTAALAPLGYKIAFDQEFDGIRVVGFSKDGKIDTWFTADKPVSGPVHLAFKADTREAVDAFYAAAMHAGGRDNGTPGIRPEYHESYYAAFVFDPDGNDIEAVYGN
jgi:catechol 2,3-dioxygenase-like lactoylglutathione lyase family enzyme